MADSAPRLWTQALVLTALLLSLVVVAQIAVRFLTAYWAAPCEIAALLDSADSSLLENESYDRDVARVPRRDDKMRLSRLLREIQRAGDDLREDLSSVLVDDDEPGSPLHRHARRGDRSADSGASAISMPAARLRTSARLLWAAKRTRLEERLRRVDLLRMRFLVVYMSIVAASATAAAEKVERSAVASAAASAASSASSSLPASPREPEKFSNFSVVAASMAAAGLTSLSTYDDRLPPASPGAVTSMATIPEAPPLPPATPRRPGHPPPLPSTPKAASSASYYNSMSPPGFPSDLLECIRQKPPLRRVSALPPRPADTSPEGNHRAGWMGVVQELQRSPLLHKRHTSIEMSATRR